MGRVMGLDIGMRRIGVALSDVMGWTAQPHETVLVERNGAHLRRLSALVKEHDVTHIIAGVPLEMDGRAGIMAKRVRKLIVKVEEALSLEVEEIDERLTTRQARRSLDEAGVRGRAQKSVVDQIAASLILQVHLDARRRQEGSL